MPVAGNGDTDRIGQEASLAPAKRRNAGRTGGDVDEVQRHHAGARGDLAIGADAADVMRVAQAVDGDAVLARGLDRPLDRLTRDHLAVAAMRVPDRDRAGVGDDLRLLVGLQVAGLEIPDIGDQHADAVAVMTAQIGLDQMVGDDVGLRRRAAAGRDDLVGERKQSRVIDFHAVSLESFLDVSALQEAGPTALSGHDLFGKPLHTFCPSRRSCCRFSWR